MNNKISFDESRIPSDTWVWGKELLLWGFNPAHQYTLKILEPKPGRIGCLSLQYHNKKSETWVVLHGVVWGLFVVGDEVVTRVMRQGDVQNIEAPMIHRLAAVSHGARVLEPSTPDEHAADKSKPKDVIRLHCVHGRECAEPRSAKEAAIVEKCAYYTEEAIKAIEDYHEPVEHNVELLKELGAHRLTI